MIWQLLKVFLGCALVSVGYQITTTGMLDVLVIVVGLFLILGAATQLLLQLADFVQRHDSTQH